MSEHDELVLLRERYRCLKRDKAEKDKDYQELFDWFNDFDTDELGRFMEFQKVNREAKQ